MYVVRRSQQVLSFFSALQRGAAQIVIMRKATRRVGKKNCTNIHQAHMVYRIKSVRIESIL